MPFEYKPHDKYDAPISPERCKASVSNGLRSCSFHQCQRKPIKDGWCKQHHPDAEKHRKEESMRRAQREMGRSTWLYEQRDEAIAYAAQAEGEVAALRAQVRELEQQRGQLREACQDAINTFDKNAQVDMYLLEETALRKLHAALAATEPEQ